MTAPVREVKVKPGDAAASRGEGEVTVMTSYEARSVGGDCVYVLETSYTACQQVTYVIELVLQTIHRFHNRFSQSRRRPLLLLVWLKAATTDFT